VPFEPDRYTAQSPEVLYDQAVVHDITHWPRSDATFYCIDVEETHNFVTSGGVVHNCRPPGNRDPLPAEVEACKPFLGRQLKLIKPKVVVALGNFAAKLLTGSSQGVTRLREREFHLRDGTPLMCTFHPAAALRGGNAAAGIGEDFEKIKIALESMDEDPEGPAEQLGLF
jgi:uracil-DNA glycosylase family 4